MPAERADWTVLLIGGSSEVEAHRAGLQVLAPRPWATLVERVVAAIAR